MLPATVFKHRQTHTNTVQQTWHQKGNKQKKNCASAALYMPKAFGIVSLTSLTSVCMLVLSLFFLNLCHRCQKSLDMSLVVTSPAWSLVSSDGDQWWFWHCWCSEAKLCKKKEVFGLLIYRQTFINPYYFIRILIPKLILSCRIDNTS